jgi:hypothetical protein
MGVRMISFHVPDDPEWLQAYGTVSVRHAHLDYILRMMVKTLADVEISEALDATRREGSAALRERVRKLAKTKLGEGTALVKLQSLLERCGDATEKRNRLIHRICARELDGGPLMRTEDHRWEDLPPHNALGDLAEEIAALTAELNRERLEGYIRAALDAKKKSTGG